MVSYKKVHAINNLGHSQQKGSITLAGEISNQLEHSNTVTVSFIV